jgi:hypothetical protein
MLRLEKQVWAVWLPVVASAALALGFFLGSWLASERQASPETPSVAQPQQGLSPPTHRTRPFRSEVQGTIDE